MGVMANLQSINPATDQWIASYPELSDDAVQSLLAAADEAFVSWRHTELDHRAARLRQAAAILRQHQADHARLMANEMGKPVAQGRAEIEKCAWVCEYYADHGARFLAPEIIASDASKSYVAFQPLGVVLAVMPWNFPFWQVFRFAVPALMAGNAAVLKHASNVSGCALAIESVFLQAGFPAPLFRTLLAGSARIPAIIQHPLIKAVTLTGSTPAGRAVAAQAGAVLKKSVLELGGSDPYLILADAELDSAVAACVTARLGNGGQSCIAAKRLIVVRSIQKEFEEKLVGLMAARVMGDPLREETDLGPLARHDLRDELHEQVNRSLAAGARCLLGGTVPPGPGAFYPPTVLTDVRPGLPAFDEELFGPVAAIVPVRDETEAITMANRSNFGLGAAVFTRDAARGERIAHEQLEAGCCFVNSFVKSDPRLPFGGVKQSGYGRELSVFGIREFVNVKTVYVK
jgi:succinate-semialdehyde dehydrogenase/glutarate-semialdehyde dehydrogenase